MSDTPSPAPEQQPAEPQSNFTPPFPAKPLAVFSLIPTNSIQIFQEIIKEDEGGWSLELSSKTGDNDGGWTYGGMTSNTFKEWFPQFSLADIKTCLEDETATTWLRRACMSIYHMKYYSSLIPALAPDMSIPTIYHVSCAVNCGEAIAFQYIKQSLSFVSDKQKKAFLGLWKEHYFAIFRSNPSRWSGDIHGWINRVWRYV